MPTLTDARFDALKVLVPSAPPTTNDMLFAWLATEGGTGNTLMDRWRTMLIGKGATPARINDMWMEVLALNGFTQPHHNDRETAFWVAGGDLTGDADTNMSLLPPNDLHLNEFAPTVVAS